MRPPYASIANGESRVPSARRAKGAFSLWRALARAAGISGPNLPAIGSPRPFGAFIVGMF